MIPLGECMYAGRKRRKPIQKLKSAPTSVKSNPSKRHRDRLNAELDHLANLLPFPPDIISKLDKLSVLRLSVSYLRVKNFFQAFEETELRKESHQFINHDMRDSQSTLLTGNWLSEGELLLDALDGFVLLVSADGMIFYVSPTIIDYLGFHQTDVMHQSVYDFIHVDDRQEFQRQLHWAMNPPQQVSGQEPPGQGASGDEYLGPFKVHDPKILPPEFSPFLNRCFISRVRCLLDSTSGFLTMQFQGRLKFLQGQRKKAGSGANLPPQLGLFCIAVPLLFPPISELKLKGLLLKGKHRLDLSPTTLDAKGKAAGWSDAELWARSSCHYLHFTDMLYCTENQVRLMDTGEKGLTVFRVLTKDGQWVWLQTNGHLPYRSKSPEYVTVPKEEPKDAERSKEQQLRNQPNADQSDGANRLVYSSCTDTSVQLKHLYEQPLAKEAGEDKYEPVRNDGGANQSEPLNFCTSFPRASKVAVTDDLWGPEYSRGVLNSQPPRTVERMSSVPVRVAKPFCGRSRFLSEPQLRGGAQVSSFQNLAQGFRGIGEEMQQSQAYGDLHYTDLEGYPSETSKSEDVGSAADFVAHRPKEHLAGYCNSAEMFLGVHIKREYNPDSRSELEEHLGSPSRQWADTGEMGKKLTASFLPQVKCDPNTLEHVSPCEKLKAPLQPPFCRASVAKCSGLWMAGSACGHNRLSKHGTDVAQFSPQRAAHSRCTHRDQPADCFQPAAYPYHPIQDKGPSQETYKIPPQFKDHDLINTVIKREPSPSTPWSCDNPHYMQATLQRNMPSCLINSLTHKSTQNTYL
ncbi:aryl-hydrocarbon receptor repressor a [Mustelus asterias]